MYAQNSQLPQSKAPMRQQQNNDVTYIDDLPDLDDIEGGMPGNGGIPHNIPEKYRKFIRPSHAPPNEAGMQSYGGPQVEHMGHMEHMGPGGQVESYSQLTNQYSKLLHGSPTCIEVADHIASCPICSRFYTNDKSACIIAIVVLAIICIILLKKVLDI